ncbi:MAG: hypothetical protein ACT4RN_04370 [Pseudonocardia sp.]
MIEFLADAGHDHGPAAGVVALLVALAVLAALLVGSAVVRRGRGRG